jgi:tight adherence protein B
MNELESILKLTAPVLIGIALAAGVVGCWPLLRQRWEKDVAWMREVLWRFSPDPPDPRPIIRTMYTALILSFVVLLFIFGVYVAVILWIVLLFVPRILVNVAWSQRRKKINEQIAPSVLQMSNSVSAGLTLVQAIDRLAIRAPEPIKTEFRIMSNQWKHGADLGSTIEDARQRLQLANFTLFSSTLLINQEMGGNVAETLDHLGGSLEAIEHMEHEVYAATSEGRMNIKVMSFAPAVIVGMLYVMDKEGTTLLFTSMLGRGILGVCLLLTALGTYLAWRVINADV